jgi:HEAT repeat protein
MFAMPLVKARTPTLASEATAGSAGADDLLVELSDASSRVRRTAARDLASYPGAAMALCDRLEAEPTPSVRSVIITSLISIGTPEVAARLARHLRSDDTQLRNAAIEALQEMPGSVAPLLERLLSDDDSDVRIFAVNILAVLHHPEAPGQLARVIRTDPHFNVCAAAVDGLAEVGGAELIPDLRDLAERFADHAFMRFAVDAAIRRIRGV